MKYQELVKQIKKKEVKPIVLLHGDEPFFIDKITALFETTFLQESEKAFNQTILYGKDVKAQQIMDTAIRFPMMAPMQVIVVKEAKQIKDIKKLSEYAANPTPTTLLVIAYKHGKLDGRSELSKLIKKNGIIFESKKLYDNDLPGWIQSLLKDYQLNIKSDALSLLSEYIGGDLSRIDGEVQKMSVNLPSGHTITTEDIEKNIGVSRQYNVFELQSAISNKDIAKIGRIIHYFEANPKQSPIQMVISSLFSFISKCLIAQQTNTSNDMALAKSMGINVRNEYAAKFRVKDYKTFKRNYSPTQTLNLISLLKEYDLKSKGVMDSGTKGELLLQELVYRIIQ